MIAGIIESYLGEELQRNVNCEIKNINMSDETENSYVDISIHII